MYQLESINEINYWIAPISSNEYIKQQTVISVLLKQEKIFGLNNKSLYKSRIKKNDKICFYLKEYGIIADAEIITNAYKEDNKFLGPHFGWVIKLNNVNIYFEKPIKIDEKMRKNLDAFMFNKINSWGWFVQTLHSLSETDFKFLTGKKKINSSL